MGAAIAAKTALLLVPSPAHAASYDATVTIIDNAFSPQIVRVPVGGSVEWTNDGRAPHTVTAAR